MDQLNAQQISARWRVALAAISSILLLALAWAPGAQAATTKLSSSVYANSLVSGPNGTVWFGGTDYEGFNVVGRVSATGELAEYKLPRVLNSSELRSLPGIAVGSDGNVWLTTESDKLLKVTQSGSITEVKVSVGETGAILAAPDGSLRFTSKQNAIGRVTTNGEASSFALPAGSEPTGLALGPEGALWIAERGGNAIARLTPDNNFTPFPLPNAGSKPNAIVLGPDGNLWFTEEGAPRIGRITPSGQISEFTVAGPAGTRLISNGPDGDLWYTQNSWLSNEIGSISTSGVTGAPACVEQGCSIPATAIAPGPAGELLYGTGVRQSEGGGGGQLLNLQVGGWIDAFTPPALVTELPGKVHLGPKRVVVVPLACEGGAAGTSCTGRVQLKNGGRAFGGNSYKVERGSGGKTVVVLKGRPAKALARNGKVKLRVVAFNDVGEGSSRAVVVRTRPRR